MIDLYTFPTGNGQRAAIMLAESGLAYEAHRIDLRKGEHKQEAFLAINPAGQIPAIIDRDGPGGRPLTLTQSNAIVLYVAEKSGRLLPIEPRERAITLERFFLVTTDIIGPVVEGIYLSILASEKVPQAVAPLREKAIRFFGYLERWLGEHPYLAGDAYSIVDIAAYAPALVLKDDGLDALPNVVRWRDTISARDAVAEGMAAAAAE